jgi:hypothetical protein
MLEQAKTKKFSRKSKTNQNLKVKNMKIKPITVINVIGALILSLGIVLVVTHCSSIPSLKKSSSVTMTGQEILNLLATNGVTPYKKIMSKDSYALVSHRWAETVTLDYRGFLYKNNLHVYNEVTNDCVDFSSNFVAFARGEFANDTKLKTTPAIGIVYFYDMFDGHAMNVIITLGQNNKPFIMYYEPQGDYTLESISSAAIIQF